MELGTSQDLIQEKWIPLLDYAVQKGVSTSTLRRYIKAKKIEFKIENGRYLLLANKQKGWDENYRVRELESQLVQAQEEISELKMLVALYEEKLK